MVSVFRETKIMKFTGMIAGVAVAIAASTVVRAEEDITKAAKKIFAERKDSVIWVSAVAKLSIKTSGGTGARPSVPEQEKKVETTATLIDASGLAVASLSTIDPSGAVDGQEIATAGGTVKISASSQIKEVKMILPDGTEVPADIVMKDIDLDLAFIRARADSPEAKDVTFKAIDLKDNAEGHILDEVVAIARLGEVFGRQPSVVTSLVASEMKKPRHRLRVPTESIGGPVFANDGRIMGITVLQRVRTETQGGQAGMTPVVIPASEILPVAEQARKAKPVSNGDAADGK